MEEYYVYVQHDIIDYIKKKEITDSSEYMEEIVDYIFGNYNYFVTDYKCYEIIDNNARILVEMIEYVTEKYLEEGKTYIYGSILELFNLFLYYRTKECALKDTYIRHVQYILDKS
jgi:hypothetical protein